jgi:hypothetical protein
MMHQVTWLAPGAAANQQTPRADSEAPGATSMQRHQVVLRKLPHPVERKTEIGPNNDYCQHGKRYAVQHRSRDEEKHQKYKSGSQ